MQGRVLEAALQRRGSSAQSLAAVAQMRHAEEQDGTPITVLDLCDTAMGINAVEALVRALPAGSTLTHIDLSKNNVGDVGAKAIAAGLKGQSAVETLLLEEARITSTGVYHIAEVIITGPSALTTLSLRGNTIGHGGLAHLRDAMLHPRVRIEHLDLSHTGLDQDAHIILGEMLKLPHGALQSLAVGWNALGHRNFDHLVHGLKRNTTLKTLDLSSTQMGFSGGQKLVRGLAHNTTLHHIAIEYNQLSNKHTMAVSELLARNRGEAPKEQHHADRKKRDKAKAKAKAKEKAKENGTEERNRKEEDDSTSPSASDRVDIDNKHNAAAQALHHLQSKATQSLLRAAEQALPSAAQQSELRALMAYMQEALADAVVHCEQKEEEARQYARKCASALTQTHAHIQDLVDEAEAKMEAERAAYRVRIADLERQLHQQ